MMTNYFLIHPTKFTTVCGLAALLVYGAAGETPGRVEVVEVSGTTEFEAPTNMPAVSVKGKSGAAQGRVTLSREPDGILLEHIEASIPIKSLSTGMAVRDEHMRKYVFTAADGRAPDLRFEADKAECSGRAGGQEFTCQVSGNLSIRAIARPLAIHLKVRQTSGQPAFKATGEAVVKLSDYEIPQPSQFGVKISNEVKLRLEFTARPRPAESSSLGGAR
jgi:polyisoprenoid-binding protein YceI